MGNYEIYNGWKMGYKPFYFKGQYEGASDEYHFSISNDDTYYIYEISDKNSNLIKEIDKQNVVVRNKNGEFYYKDYDNDGNRVLN